MVYQELQVQRKLMHNRILIIILSGRHCCLWCRIERGQLKEFPSKRTEQPVLRDLHTIAAAHSDFVSKGEGNLKVAKKYFNAIATPFFNIPVDQVSTVRWCNRINEVFIYVDMYA